VTGVVGMTGLGDGGLIDRVDGALLVSRDATDPGGVPLAEPSGCVIASTRMHTQVEWSIFPLYFRSGSSLGNSSPRCSCRYFLLAFVIVFLFR